MKKVSGDANFLETGLRDWIEQQNSSSLTWLKHYKTSYDLNLKNCWYESSKSTTPISKDKNTDLVKKLGPRGHLLII